jgi:hypothetical protein
MANAGQDQKIAVRIPVTLDGSASEAPSGEPVSYQWTLTAKPAGSIASLANPTSVRPTFTPDVSGSYSATLVVRANGVQSQPDTVDFTCNTGDIAPFAYAGPDRSTTPGETIILDGTPSKDPNNMPLTYSWRLVDQPQGSNPVLSNATTATPTFRADVVGVYTVALTVSDGSLTSEDEAEITVALGQLPPVANAGPDQTVRTGQLVTLNGGGSSDPNGDPLAYNWCLRGRPQGSTATLKDLFSAQATFTPDVPGSYVICLTVIDLFHVTSTPDTVVVEARGPSTGGGGTGGTSFNQGSGFNGIVRSIVVADDGSRDVYVGGEFTSYNGTLANGLIRLHPDGTVAHTFGQGVDGAVMDLVFAKTGGGELYVIGGFTHFDGHPVPPLIRLTRTGSLDTGFRLPAGFTPSFPIVAAEDGSGDLYATFTIPNPNATNPGESYLLNIARLNADGSVDPAFSTRPGFPTGSSGIADQMIRALMSMSTGKLYVGGGMYSYNGVSVPSLLRLNADGTLDSTFKSDVHYLQSGIPKVLDLVPVGDGTGDIYAALWDESSIRLHDTGATDTSYQPAVHFLAYAIAPVQDGSGDVLLAQDRGNLYRFKRNGIVVPHPTYLSPPMDHEAYSIVPIFDGTGDVYIGGEFTMYDGVVVNHFARIHGDGALASVISTGP